MTRGDTHPVSKAAREISARGTPAYLYHFNQKLPGWPDYDLLGIFHTRQSSVWPTLSILVRLAPLTRAMHAQLLVSPLTNEGIYHSIEIPFVFGNPGRHIFSPDEQAVSCPPFAPIPDYYYYYCYSYLLRLQTPTMIARS